jgi:hypothetical protein
MNRKIGQVAGVVKVGDAAGNTNEQRTIPGAYDEIRICHHSFHARPILYRPALSTRRAFKQANELVSCDGMVHFEVDAHTFPWQLTFCSLVN